jgi:hypothetical protein
MVVNNLSLFSPNISIAESKSLRPINARKVYNESYCYSEPALTRQNKYCSTAERRIFLGIALSLKETFGMELGGEAGLMRNLTLQK